MKTKEEFKKEVVDYFKGKDIKKADRLLLETAQNNFQAGKQEEQARILKIIDEWFNDCGMYISTPEVDKLKSKIKGEK